MKTSQKLLLGLFGGGGLVLAAPALVSPADDFVSDDPTPTFSWEAVVNADTYEMQIASDSGFGSIVDSDDALAVTSYTPSSSIDPGDGPSSARYWRVRAKTPVEGEWSEVRSLTFSAASYLLTLTTAGFIGRLNATDTINNIGGSDALDGTVQGSPSLVNSPFGTNQGLALDANGKRLRMANSATVVALGNAASFTVIARLRLAASPGNTSRYIYSFENSNHRLAININDTLDLIRTSSGTAARAISSGTIPEGSNVKVASVFNPADKPNGIRLYSGATSFSEMALGTDTTMTGTLGAITTQNLFFGDRALGDVSVLAEMCDFVAKVPVGMTLAQLNVVAARIPD